MTNIICDLCKRPIPAAIRNYSWESRHERYDTYKDKDICPECLEKLHDEIHAELEEKPVFRFDETKTILEKKLTEMGAWTEKERNKFLDLD
ncbi:MAG TPA: hypothetical protein VMX75_00585 [Spirochaetia bacterium]|nr:hypothetical protein [Spirochaetia bacterium]